MEKKWLSLLIAVVMVMSLVFVGCAKPAPVTPTPEKEPIVIGHIGDYSGVCEMYSTTEKKALDLAIDECNAAGGILGRPVEMLDRDGGLKPDIGCRELKDLILREKVDFAWGPCSSGELLALEEVLGEYDILGVTCIANTEKCTVHNYNGHYLQCVTNTYEIGTSCARRFHRDYPDGKRIYGFNQDYEYGHACWEAFVDEFKELVPDAVIVGEAFPKLGETEYSAFITAMLAKADEIDFVMSSHYAGDLIAFTKQAAPTGFFDKVHFVGLYDKDALKALGADAPEGTYGHARGDFFAEPDNPKMKEFAEKYHKLYSEYPACWATAAYDGFYALKAAIEKAGTTETSAVVEALRGMDFTGTRGHTPIRSELMMAVPSYTGIITLDSPYDFPIWRDIVRYDGLEVLRPEEDVLRIHKELGRPIIPGVTYPE